MAYTKAPEGNAHGIVRVPALGSPFEVANNSVRIPQTLNYLDCYPVKEEQFGQAPLYSVTKREALKSLSTFNLTSIVTSAVKNSGVTGGPTTLGSYVISEVGQLIILDEDDGGTVLAFCNVLMNSPQPTGSGGFSGTAFQYVIVSLNITMTGNTGTAITVTPTYLYFSSSISYLGLAVPGLFSVTPPGGTAAAVGASCSFAGSVMTCNVAPTAGAFAVGNSINANGVLWNVKITSLGTGTGGVGTYNLSATVGTIASETVNSFVPYGSGVLNTSVDPYYLVSGTASTPSGGGGSGGAFVVPAGNNVSLQTVAIAQGVSLANPVNITFQINAGTVIGNLSTGGGWAAGTTITLNNSGTILGTGGTGGGGTTVNNTNFTVTPPTAGTPAITLNWPMNINNLTGGLIAGGGGGGGFGQGPNVSGVAGSGGGGAGYTGGAAGAQPSSPPGGGAARGVAGVAGGSWPSTAGGAGGVQLINSGSAPYPGAGGSATGVVGGNGGQTGTTPNIVYAAGGGGGLGANGGTGRSNYPNNYGLAGNAVQSNGKTFTLILANGQPYNPSTNTTNVYGPVA